MAKKSRRMQLGEELRFPAQRDQIMSVIRSERITTPVKQKAARAYAERRGISYKSALRTVDRYTTTTAAQKRGVARPNADIVQAIVDAHNEWLRESGELYERVVDPPPPDTSIHQFTNVTDTDNFDDAVALADGIADGYAPSVGSDPRLSMVIARGAGLLREASYLIEETGETVYYHTPHLRKYEVAAIYWVERH